MGIRRRIATLALLAALVAASPAGAQYLMTTVAGGGGMTTADNGAQATNLPLDPIYGPATDAAGNVYAAAGQGESLLLRISPAGVLNIIAGQPGLYGSYSGDGGPAVNATLLAPRGVTIDRAGMVYFADTWNNRIRRIDPDGVIWDVAGNGTPGFTGDGGPAVYAGLNGPQGVAVDVAGNVYVADTSNCRVRKVDLTGTISTFAGTGTCGFLGDGGPAVSAVLGQVADVVLDSAGNLLLADYTNQRIRKIDTSGNINTIAGNGSAVASGDGGPALSAGLGWFGNLALDAAGNIDYPYEFGVRKISTSGIITTVAGNGSTGYSGDGGPALSAGLVGPQAVAFDGNGNMYIGGEDGRIRKVAPGVIISTFAGETPTYYNDGAQANTVEFAWTNSVLASQDGGFYVIAGARVVKVSSAGVISLVAGSGNGGSTGDGGPAVNATLAPYGIAQDASGNLLVTDGNRIRKIDANGIITTVAGNGTFGFIGDGGLATAAELAGPTGVAVDPSGNLYIADTGNHSVRMVNPQGIITTFAGNGQDGSSGDNGPAIAAELSAPNALAFDASGNLYIVDAAVCAEAGCPYGAGGGERVRKVDPTGTITTFAGNGTGAYTGDGGPATSASLCFPVGVTVDRDGNVFILDAGNDAVRRVDLTATISTVSFLYASGVGYLNLSVNDYSKAGGGISADASGNLYIANYFNAVVLKGTKVTGTYVDATGNAADNQPVVSPGSLMSVYGLNLSSQVASPLPPLPNSAGDTTVTLGNLPVPLLYVSPTQINLQIPFEAPLGADTLTVSRASTGTTTMPVQVVAASPGIFRARNRNLGAQGAITNVNGLLMGPYGTGIPATPGEYIQIWCTGLGAVTNQPPTGSTAPAGPPYSQTLQTPVVNIGGISVPTLFAALAPGYVGLYQIDVQVPLNAPVGDQIQVTVSMGNIFDTVTMAIAAQ